MDARLICGQDVRQTGFWPTDEARLEAFVERFGGTLEAGPIGDVAVMFRWVHNGRTIITQGVTAREALRKLRLHAETEYAG